MIRNNSTSSRHCPKLLGFNRSASPANRHVTVVGKNDPFAFGGQESGSELSDVPSHAGSGRTCSLTRNPWGLSAPFGDTKDSRQRRGITAGSFPCSLAPCGGSGEFGAWGRNEVGDRTLRMSVSEGALTGLQNLLGGTRRAACRAWEATSTTRSASRDCLVAPSAQWFGSLSSQMQEQNLRTTHNTRVLNVHQPTQTPGKSKTAVGGMSNDGNALDADAFLRSTEQLVTSISDLHRRQMEFDPQISRSSGDQRSSRRRRQETGDAEDDEIDRLNERIEAYKMARRVEPEAPPLSRSILSESIPPKHVDTARMTHNASFEAVMSWSPMQRKERLTGLKNRWISRHAEVVADQDRKMEQRSASSVKVLTRKRLQGETALANRRAGRPKQLASEIDSIGKKWLSMCGIVCFLEKVHVSIRIKSDQSTPLLDLVEEHTSSTLEVAGDICGEFLEERRAQVAQVRRAVCAIVDVFLARKEIARRRKMSYIMFQSLSAWRTDGRLMLGLFGFAKRIRGLQKWWRRTSKELRQVRDVVAKRWEKLEHAEVLRELLRKDPSLAMPTSPAFSVAASIGGVGVAKLSPFGGGSQGGNQGQAGNRGMLNRPVVSQAILLEERIRFEMLDEAHRLRFIENELRARRFAILPQIELWQQDSKRWFAESRDCLDTRNAFETLGLNKEEGPAFRWSPVRPSYMPPAHPLSEARGEPCAVDCRGRMGDEEILRMYRAAKAAGPRGGGWTLIEPCRAAANLMSCNVRRSSKASQKTPSNRSRDVCNSNVTLDNAAASEGNVGVGQRSPSSRPRLTSKRAGRDSYGEALGPYGEASAEDLKRWGVFKGMPGPLVTTFP